MQSNIWRDCSFLVALLASSLVGNDSLALVKGTVARDFRPLIFFHQSTPFGPLIHTIKYFRIRLRIRRDIQFEV
jgi:hypothetical protein